MQAKWLDCRALSQSRAGGSEEGSQSKSSLISQHNIFQEKCGSKESIVCGSFIVSEVAAEQGRPLRTESCEVVMCWL